MQDGRYAPGGDGVTYPDMAEAMKDDRARRRGIVVTALLLGALALAFYLSTFLKGWS